MKTKTSGKHVHGLVKYNQARKLSNETVFVENSTYPRHRLKERIIKQSIIDYKCSCCGNVGVYNDKPLSLQLDHINGINNDNRLDNLRFLCPNCHAQSDTYAAKNIVNKKNNISVAQLAE